MTEAIESRQGRILPCTRGHPFTPVPVFLATDRAGSEGNLEIPDQGPTPSHTPDQAVKAGYDEDDRHYRSKVQAFSKQDMWECRSRMAQHAKDDPFEAKMRQFAEDGNVRRIQGHCGQPAAEALVQSKTAKHPKADSGTSGEEEVMVEIAPGERVKLRRTQETIRAVVNDFYAPVNCFACGENLFCIADVSYVVCPKCQVVSPLDPQEDTFDGQSIERHGLGLGITVESLFRMQSEIFQNGPSKLYDKKG
jgi:hypothetical protein